MNYSCRIWDAIKQKGTGGSIDLVAEG